MNKVAYPYLLPIATDQGVGGDFSTEVNNIVSVSPYYQSCIEAFDKKGALKQVPYAATYNAANAEGPYFYEDVLSEPSNKQPIIQVAKAAKSDVERRYFKKNILVLILIFVFSLIAIALPIISNFALLEQYINIGVDVLDITDIFSSKLSISILADDLPILLLALFMVFSLVLMIKSVFAILGKKKRSFVLLSLIAVIIALAFVLAVFEFDFQELIGDIASLDYGIYALIGCPLLIFILSFLSYKKLRLK